MKIENQEIYIHTDISNQSKIDSLESAQLAPIDQKIASKTTEIILENFNLEAKNVIDNSLSNQTHHKFLKKNETEESSSTLVKTDQIFRENGTQKRDTNLGGYSLDSFNSNRNIENDFMLKQKERDNFIWDLQNGNKALKDATNPDLKKDKEVVLAAISHSFLAFEDADPDLKKDKEFILSIVKQNGLALIWVAPELKKDREIVLTAVTQNGQALQHADPELKNDEKIVLAAVRQYGEALRYAHPALKKNEKVVLAAINQSGYAISRADPIFKNNKDLALLAVKKNGGALSFVDKEFRKNREIALCAVTQDGNIIEIVDPMLRKEKEFILAAIRTHRNPEEVMQYAGPELRNNKEFMLAILAITGNGFLFSKASSELQQDKAFILLCMSVQKNTNILHRIDKQLLGDTTFRKEVRACNPLFLLNKNGDSLSLDSPPPDSPSTLLVKDMVMKIRKPHIQNQLLRIAYHLGEDKNNLGENTGRQSVENLLQKQDNPSRSYPKHLQLIALCLRTRFPDKDISPFLDKLAKSEFKSLIKDQNKGLQESLIKLLIGTPGLDQKEIQAFFDDLPKPQDLKKHIARISNFLSVASYEERKNLINILDDTETSKENLIAACVSCLRQFIAPHHFQHLDQIMSNPVSEELLSYLTLHRDNEEMRTNIETLLNAILEDKFPEERYLPTSLHLEILQKNAPDTFSHWKNLSSFKIQTSLEENEREVKTYTFQNFLLQKLSDNHLHPDLAQAIQTKSTFSDPEKNECLSYMNNLTLGPHLPDAKQIKELKMMLQKAKLSSNEFEDDLDALIQREVTLSKIEVSDKWEDLLLSGIEGSCQMIGGDKKLNKCLLAYVLDGKNQMLCVKDPQGKIVGRCILRLLLDRNQKPSIFMERFYGNISVQHSIEKAAEEISKELRLPLYVTGEGPMLHSLGSPAAFEYSDAADDENITNGCFKHTGLLKEIN